MTIKNNLRFYRKKAELRQHEVAQALGLNCTDRISRWENGAAVPHLVNLFKLSVIYKVRPQDLYGELFQTIENDLATPPFPKSDRMSIDGHPELSTPFL
jgi:transcriptional regulator with XRE-family HTH domain